MDHEFPHITSHCFINVPFPRLRDNIDKIIANGIRPEIGLNGDTLYKYSTSEFASVASSLKNAGLASTLHAPFSDLNPGASDPYIREASNNKLKKALALIPIFEPASVVCHLNYEPHKHDYDQQGWLENSLASWRELLDVAQAHQTTLMLENTYEHNPTIHKLVLETLDSPYAQFCLDVGHTLAFAKNSWQEWLPQLTPWLGQLHLHDNLGDKDSHLPVGSGIFDFVGLFSYLTEQKLKPIITLEPHDEETLIATLANIDSLSLFP